MMTTSSPPIHAADRPPLVDLPQDPQVWLGEARPVDATVAGEPMALVLWVEADTGLIRSGQPVSAGRPADEVLVESLRAAMLENGARIRPARPRSVAVRREHVVAVQAALAGLGVEVLELERPQALDEIFTAFHEKLFTSPGYLVPGVTRHDILLLFKAACNLWALAPWRTVPNGLLLKVEGVGPPELSFSVLGSGGIERGLSIHLDREAARAAARGDAAAMRRSRLISLSWDRIEDAPDEVVEQVDQFDWPISEENGQELVPAVLCPAAAPHFRPGPQELAVFHDVLSVLKTLCGRDDFPGELIEGRRISVQLPDRREVQVEYADSCELAQQGLSRQQRRKLARRGGRV